VEEERFDAAAASVRFKTTTMYASATRTRDQHFQHIHAWLSRQVMTSAHHFAKTRDIRDSAGEHKRRMLHHCLKKLNRTACSCGFRCFLKNV
jgi:hypothetical protein